jgi:hypothetical protein
VPFVAGTVLDQELVMVAAHQDEVSVDASVDHTEARNVAGFG